MQEFYDNTSIIANNLINVRKCEQLSKRQAANIFRISVYYITLWDSGKGKIPHEIIRISALWARCSVKEFISAEQSVEEIRRRNCLFEARTTAEIPRKYCNQKNEQIF